MAWQDSMVTALRVLINDMDSVSYTDSRLEQVLVVAASLVVQDIDFSTTYDISVIDIEISPDPTVNPTKDNAFANFVVMRAACLSDWSTFRCKALMSNIKVKVGPAALETMQHLDGFKELLSVGPCAAYEKMKDNWIFGNGAICKAILSPFVGNDFDASSLGNSGNYR